MYPSFQLANELLDEISTFLQDCGGVYETITGDCQRNILLAIVANQYIISRDEAGKINHFLCYAKIMPEDIELLKEGIEPQHLFDGTVIWVVEHGNKSGRKGLMDFIKEIRRRAVGCQGVLWYHKGQDLVYYPNQKGSCE